MREDSTARQWPGAAALALALLLAVPASTAPAAPRAAPVEPLDDALLEPGGFERFSFEEAVLMASGARTRESLERDRGLLAASVARVAASLDPAARTDEERAEALLHALHGELLGEYVAGTRDLRRTLRTGQYNCLTATTLYLLAARKLGLLAKAYAMQGHVMALVFLGDGPRYVETTNPEVQPSKTWDQPFGVLQETLTQARAVAEPHARKHYGDAALSQLLGLDEEAEASLRAVDELDAEVIRVAREREQQFRESAFEVNPKTLVSLFYWNRSVAAAKTGDEAQALRALSIAMALGSEQWSEQALGVRVFELRGVLADHARTHGWAAVVKVLGTMIRVVKKAREKLVLRDLRAQAWVNWIRERPARRCRVVREALGLDPEHPAVRLLGARSASWKCPATP